MTGTSKHNNGRGVQPSQACQAPASSSVTLGHGTQMHQSSPQLQQQSATKKKKKKKKKRRFDTAVLFFDCLWHNSLCISLHARTHAHTREDAADNGQDPREKVEKAVRAFAQLHQDRRDLKHHKQACHRHAL